MRLISKVVPKEAWNRPCENLKAWKLKLVKEE